MTYLSEDERQHIRVHVGAKLRKRRQAAGMSQAVLARRMGMSLNVVAELEQGQREPDLGLLIHAALVLGVPVEAFFEALPETLTQLHIVDPDLCPPENAGEAFALVKHFTRIPEREVRARLLKLALAAAAGADAPAQTSH